MHGTWATTDLINTEMPEQQGRECLSLIPVVLVF
jgi:hypothetical protein